jgi:hypothetical protein
MLTMNMGKEQHFVKRGEIPLFGKEGTGEI